MSTIELLEDYMRQGEKPWNWNERRLIEMALSDLRSAEAERRAADEAARTLPGRGEAVFETADGLRSVGKMPNGYRSYAPVVERRLHMPTTKIGDSVPVFVEIRKRTYELVGSWLVKGMSYPVYREMAQ